MSVPFLLLPGMAIHYYQEVIKMSLSISDTDVFSGALKKARINRKLTQAECAELLDHSLSFQKDLERGRCSPSIEGFYNICRMLDISADDCIFQGGFFFCFASHYICQPELFSGVATDSGSTSTVAAAKRTEQALHTKHCCACFHYAMKKVCLSFWPLPPYL